jgi:hypothetical protein
MYSFSESSQQKLNTCDSRLIVLMNHVIRRFNITILCGHREEEEQNRLYNAGRSQLQYPHSFHNRFPSLAVDIAPWPIDWQDIYNFYYMAGIVRGTAFQLGIDIVWGGHWPNFKDYPHFQLKT